MTQDENDAVNAALLLEEKINDRVIAAIQARSFELDQIILNSLQRAGRYNSAFQGLIIDCLKERIR